MLLCLLLSLPLAQDPVAAAEPRPQPPRRFVQVVQDSFAQWDQDADGVLSVLELDRACLRPDVRGEEAAAIAAIKRVVRSGKYEVPPLSLAGLSPVAPAAPEAAENEAAENGAAETGAAETGAAGTVTEAGSGRRDADREDSGEPSVAAPAQPLKKPNFQSSYAGSLRKIARTRRGLFLDETPDLDACRQGPLGDCFFVAAVGAFVQRDGLDLKRMITQTPDGSFVVAFGDGSRVEVAALTDAELALSGTTGDEGLWLPVLEKAIGTLRQQANPQRFETRTATDAISKGGSSAAMVRILTGHKTERLPLRRRPRGTQKGENGATVPKPSVLAGAPAALASKVRGAVGLALAERRLVTCGTLNEKQPPGLSGKHAYAVLAFDAERDVLTVWNPHGNAFKPKGDPGLVHGYPTKAGLFTLPVLDFVQIFGSVSWQTDEPLPRKAEAPAADGDGKQR